MKKSILILVILMSLTLLLGGCSSVSKTDNAVSDSKEDNKVGVSNEYDEAKAVVDSFFEDLIKEDFESLVLKYSNSYLAYLNQTPEQIVQNFKEKFFKNSMKSTEYLISELNKYDDTHMYAKVLVKVEENSVERTITDEFMLVKENGEWKIDYSMILSEEPLPNEFSNDFIKFTDFKKLNRIHGMALVYKVELLSKEHGLSIGFVNEGTASLITDKGTYTATLTKEKFSPESSFTYTIKFEDAEGAIERLTLTNFNFTLNGLPDLKSGGDNVTYEFKF